MITKVKHNKDDDGNDDDKNYNQQQDINRITYTTTTSIRYGGKVYHILCFLIEEQIAVVASFIIIYQYISIIPLAVNVMSSMQILLLLLLCFTFFTTGKIE